jgi:cyclopropane-fatty-acyl-phospholipid synthase
METITNTISKSYKTTLYRQIVFSIFEKLTKGSLELTLPEGQTIILGDGDGITCNMNILDEKFFKHVVFNGDIGFGEAYVDRYWDTSSISKVIQWIISNIDDAPMSGGKKAVSSFNLLDFIYKVKHRFRDNSVTGSRKNISFHYDLSNEMYKHFLDETMTYSSAYFSEPSLSLKDAQLSKYDMLAKSLEVKSSDHVLEIGCGWGGLSIFLAKHYGCKVTGITISQEQFKYATEKVKEEGVEDLVSIVFKDYRDLTGKFDKIASIEMIEAVGAKYYQSYFSQIEKLLAPNGMVCIQAITSPDSRFEDFKKGSDWIQTYIFPGSLLPSIGEMNKTVNKFTNMHLVNLKDFGNDYTQTLNIWAENFNKNWDKIKALGFDDSFKRKWNYYLEYCQAAFYMRNISVVQVTYSRPNNVKANRKFNF